MQIDYKLTGTGWAECTITIDHVTCTVTASYLSDCLKDFVDAVCNLLQGDQLAKFSFDEEPGEYRWILESVSKEKMDVSIIEFQGLWNHKPDNEGKIIFQARTVKKDFAEALKQALESILGQHGVSGYKENWAEHDFPLESYQRLCSLLISMAEAYG